MVLAGAFLPRGPTSPYSGVFSLSFEFFCAPIALFDNPFYTENSTSNILDKDLPMVADLLEYRVNFLESLLDEKDPEIFGLQEELQQLKEPHTAYFLDL